MNIFYFLYLFFFASGLVVSSERKKGADIFAYFPIPKLIDSSNVFEYALNRHSVSGREHRYNEVKSAIEDVVKEIESERAYLFDLRKKLIEVRPDSREIDSDDKIGNHYEKQKTDDRIKNLTELISLLQLIVDEILHLHQKFLKDDIEYFSRSSRLYQQGKQDIYSFQDLEKLELLREENRVLFEQAQKDLESAKKNKIANAEKIKCLRSELAVWKETLSAYTKKPIEDFNVDDALAPQGVNPTDQVQLFNESILLTKEKIAFFEWEEKKYSFEISFLEDKVDVYSRRYNEAVASVELAKERLSVSKFDLIRSRQQKQEIERKIAIERGQLVLAQERAKKNSEEHQSQLDVFLETQVKYDGVQEEIGHALGEIKKIRLSNEVRLSTVELNAATLALHSLDLQQRAADFSVKNINLRYQAQREDFISEGLLIILKSDWQQLENDLRRVANDRDKIISSFADLGRDSQYVTKIFAAIEKEHTHHDSNKLTKGSRSLLSELSNEFALSRECFLRERTVSGSYYVAASDFIKSSEGLINKHKTLIKEFELKKDRRGIFTRSSGALTSEDVKLALSEGERAITQFFWGSFYFLDSTSFFKNVLKAFSFKFFVGLLLFFAGVAFALIMFLIVIRWTQRTIHYALIFCESKWKGFLLEGFSVLTEVLYKHGVGIGILFFSLYFYQHQWLAFSLSVLGKEGRAILIVLAGLLGIKIVGAVQVEMGLVQEKLPTFFSHEAFWKDLGWYIQGFFYGTIAIITAHWTILIWPASYIHLGKLLWGFYSVLSSIAFISFFQKKVVFDVFGEILRDRTENILSLLENYFSITHDFFYQISFLFAFIEKHFFVLHGLLYLIVILSNPYVGCSKIAWFLFLAIPLTIFIGNRVLKLYDFVRKTASSFFIEERDEEIVDRFAHARVYYGLFIVFISILLFGVLGIMLTKLWGFQYTFGMLFAKISDEWVIKFGPQSKLGLIEIFWLIVICIFADIISSIMNRMVLSTFFEISRFDQGLRNTISRVCTYILMITAVFGWLISVNLSQIAAVLLGGFVLGFGLGLKDQFADVIAGLLILFERQIEIGHFVQLPKLDNLRGTVAKISVRSTTIRTMQNYLVVVPNTQMISNAILNWSSGRYSIGFEFSFTIDYRFNPTMIIDVAKRVIYSHALVLRVPSPIVRLEKFDSLGATYFVRCYLISRRVKEQWEIASELRIALYHAFSEIGVPFPYPRRIIVSQEGLKKEVFE